MQRNDVLRELAVRCRTDQWSALFALGYLAQAADTAALEDLLAALREGPRFVARADHRKAYEERWGVTLP